MVYLYSHKILMFILQNSLLFKIHRLLKKKIKSGVFLIA